MHEAGILIIRQGYNIKQTATKFNNPVALSLFLGWEKIGQESEKQTGFLFIFSLPFFHGTLCTTIKILVVKR